MEKTYYIAICDDDPAYIQYAKDLFLRKKVTEENLIFYEYFSGEELLEDLDHHKYDLLLLDIQLPGMDGNATAKIFREKFPDALLIFCSGIYLPTTESFESTPYRYLLKSYPEERMETELEQIYQKMRTTKPTPLLFGKRNHKHYRIPLSQVQYIEIAKRGSIIHTFESGEKFSYFSGMKVTDHYLNFCDFGFAYAHNSYIVHFNAISTVTANELELVSGEKLSISRSQSKNFRQKFAAYLSQKY